VIPKSILINNQTINVVDKFRLLGVLVDNKLKFDAYVAQQCLAINRRLFNIKKLFFLSQEVKMTFFKAFILPSFDYYISLALYYIVKRVNKNYVNRFIFAFLSSLNLIFKIRANSI
jgi:hypothetical protein